VTDNLTEKMKEIVVRRFLTGDTAFRISDSFGVEVVEVDDAIRDHLDQRSDVVPRTAAMLATLIIMELRAVSEYNCAGLHFPDFKHLPNLPGYIEQPSELKCIETEWVRQQGGMTPGQYYGTTAYPLGGEHYLVVDFTD